jgi:hypothetical protein
MLDKPFHGDILYTRITHQESNMTRTELAAELANIDALPIPGYDKGIRKQALVDAKRATWADIAAECGIDSRRAASEYAQDRD